MRSATRTGCSGRHATSPYASLSPAARAATSVPTSVIVDGVTTSGRSSCVPNASESAPSGPIPTDAVTGGNGVVAGASRTASTMPRFQKIVRAVAVQSRSPVTSRVASSSPASSSQVGCSDPIATRSSCADASAIRSPASTDRSARPTPTTAAVTHAKRRGSASTRAPATRAAATSAARAQPSEPSRMRPAAVGAFGSVSGVASCAIGTVAAPTTTRPQSGSTTGSARGAPREIHAQSPIASSGQER